MYYITFISHVIIVEKELSTVIQNDNNDDDEIFVNHRIYPKKYVWTTHTYNNQNLFEELFPPIPPKNATVNLSKKKSSRNNSPID